MLRTRSVDPAALGTRAGATSVRRAGKLAALPVAQRILGIDPGLHRTGYGLIDVAGVEAALPRFRTSTGPKLASARAGNPQLLEAGILTAKAKDEFPRRLQDLHDGLAEILAEHEPDIMVIEDLFSTYAHPRSALLMAHARGVLMLAAAEASISVHTFTPNEVKQVVTGNGHAGKAAVQAAVRARLQLAAAPDPPDVADALAIALCFALRQGTRGTGG